MAFTKEQITEIKNRLSVLGVKDTDFEKLDLSRYTLSGDEIVAIVKDGKNYQISLEELLAYGSEAKKIDIINLFT